jgi:hypothetical protein
MPTMQMPAREPTGGSVVPTTKKWNLPAILIRAYGAVFLYVACVLTAYAGAATPMVTQGTSYESTVVYLLLAGAGGVALVGSLLTWLPRADKVYRLCVWMPYIGIIALVILWAIANDIAGGRLL